MRALTPDSASPEQIRGEPVTVATDVYSLGVLLYGLLTGRSPYRGDMTRQAGIVQAVCLEEPLPPSDLLQKRADASADHTAHPIERREVRGDLDAIALKALRKEPRGATDRSNSSRGHSPPPQPSADPRGARRLDLSGGQVSRATSSRRGGRGDRPRRDAHGDAHLGPACAGGRTTACGRTAAIRYGAQARPRGRLRFQRRAPERSRHDGRPKAHHRHGHRVPECAFRRRSGRRRPHARGRGRVSQDRRHSGQSHCAESQRSRWVTSKLRTCARRVPTAGRARTQSPDRYRYGAGARCARRRVLGERRHGNIASTLLGNAAAERGAGETLPGRDEAPPRDRARDYPIGQVYLMLGDTANSREITSGRWRSRKPSSRRILPMLGLARPWAWGTSSLATSAILERDTTGPWAGSNDPQRHSVS